MMLDVGIPEGTSKRTSGKVRGGIPEKVFGFLDGFQWKLFG